MSIDQKSLATIKNLENQIRIFLFDNSYLFKNHPSMFPMFNLLSNVAPIQYLFKEFMGPHDEEREEELITLINDYLNRIEQDFRVLSRRLPGNLTVQDVWYSLYEVYLVLEENDFPYYGFRSLKEFEPFLES